MKKLIILALATVAAISFSSCAKKASTTDATYSSSTTPTYGYSK